MLRRHFIAGMAALAVCTALPAVAGPNVVDYRPGVIEDALAAGKTVFVDYSADWCLTCKSQERTVSRLVEENPAYQQAMLFVRVDWDDYRKAAVTLDRNIPRRSTLLVLKGNRELGRIVAGTSKADIKALLDKGL